MTATNSIKCDECGEERIIDSCYPKVLTLEVKTINTNTRTSGEFYMVDQSDMFEEVHHFCNTECLTKYLQIED